MTSGFPARRFSRSTQLRRDVTSLTLDLITLAHASEPMRQTGTGSVEDALDRARSRFIGAHA
jgi:hypothetical protein